MVNIRNLWKYDGDRPLLRGISLSVAPGEMLGVIGPNGSGKTTLVRLLSAEESPEAGEIRLGGRPLTEWSARERARQMAVLPQEGLPPTPFTVEEVVSMGRHPHRGWWPWSGSRDAEAVEQVLEETGLQSNRNRRVDRLSGGERQRVAIAKAMAQQPRLLVLDEPTTYLDIAYQLSVLDGIQQWRRREGLAVLVILHDLNLAAQYCDRLLLMKEGALFAEGTPGQVLTPERIWEVYGVQPVLTEHPVTGAPQVLLTSGEQAPAENRESAVPFPL